jgi:hypothetical protein
MVRTLGWTWVCAPGTISHNYAEASCFHIYMRSLQMLVLLLDSQEGHGDSPIQGCGQDDATETGRSHTNLGRDGHSCCVDFVADRQESTRIKIRFGEI